MALKISPGMGFRDRWGFERRTLDITVAVESLTSFRARRVEEIVASWDARPTDAKSMATALRFRASAQDQSPFSVIVCETRLTRYGYIVVPGPLTARNTLAMMVAASGIGESGIDPRTFSILATWHEAGHVIEPPLGRKVTEPYPAMLAERWCDALGAAAALAITGDVASVLAWARLREGVARKNYSAGGTDWMLHDVAGITRTVVAAWNGKVGWDGLSGPLALASIAVSTAPMRTLVN